MAGWFPLFAPAVSGFNGKKLQTNFNAMVGDFAFLNWLKAGSSPGFNDSSINAPVTPDMLDANGYLITQSGNAAQGVNYLSIIPSQAQRPGNHVITWDGNGQVDSGVTSKVVVSYTITGVTQSGTIQTVILSAPPTEMAAGQPIGLSGISGTWAALSNNWRVLDVNIAGNSFRVDSGTNYSGSATLATPKATFVATTTVGNAAGNLNGSGRYAFTPSATEGGGSGMNAYVAIWSIASSSDYPHNIKAFHISDEAALNAGQLTSAIFRSRAANFGVHRFLNWQQGIAFNLNNTSTWWTRKPSTYVSYNYEERRKDIYTGATTSLTAPSVGLSATLYSTSAPTLNSVDGSAFTALQDKTTVTVLFSQGTWTSQAGVVFTNGNPDVTIPGHTYQVGDKVAFGNPNGNASIPSNFGFGKYLFVTATGTNTARFSATSTGAITPNATSAGSITGNIGLFLKVGSTAAKPILNIYSGPLGDGFWPISGTYQSLATLVYDATFDAYIKFGGDHDYASTGLVNGTPWEAMLQECVETGAHPWFVTPFLASDPITDYMPQLMYNVKVSKPSWMIPRFEPPNELWNGRFPQTAYASAKALSYGWVNLFNDWYGKALSTLGQAAATIYGGVNNQYQMIGSVQTAFPTTGDLPNALPRFSSAAYISSGAAPSPMSGPWGTITFNAASGTAEAYRWTYALGVANYFTSTSYQASDGTQTLDSLATAWGGSYFTATSISAGSMVVTSVSGATLSNGATISGAEVPSGVTIISSPGGGGAGTYTLSNSSFSVSSTQIYLAGVDTTAPVKLADSVVDTVVNATISGNTFTVNSITSGNTIGGNLQIYGGTIPFASQVYINFGGTYPNFTLNASPGNQTASFKIGQTFSQTGTGLLYLNWGTWWNTNFGGTKLAGYEGGYSNDYDGNFSHTMVTAASKQSASLQALAKLNWDNFRGIGDITFPPGVVGEFPSVYNMTGVYPTGDAWSVWDNAYQSPSPPQGLAAEAY